MDPPGAIQRSRLLRRWTRSALTCHARRRRRRGHRRFFADTSSKFVLSFLSTLTFSSSQMFLSGCLCPCLRLWPWLRSWLCSWLCSCSVADSPVPGGACGHAADGRGGSACPPARAPAARAAQEHRQLHIVSYLVWGNEKSSVLLYSWRVVQDHQTRLPLLGIFMVV